VAGSPLIPRAPLIAAGAFGAPLSPARVAAALARGLAAGGVGECDICLLPASRADLEALRATLGELHFDARLHRARAVIVAERRLDERTLQRSTSFEVATRARQSGVPAYAVTAHNGLDAFDARLLDLQAIFVAAAPRALAATGAELARLL
jgi:glycerate kinase